MTKVTDLQFIGSGLNTISNLRQFVCPPIITALIATNFVEHYFPGKIHFEGQKFDYIPIFCNMRITD